MDVFEFAPEDKAGAIRSIIPNPPSRKSSHSSVVDIDYFIRACASKKLILECAKQEIEACA
ncbi:hypothetical protein D3C76_674460 [compost metagenome]